MDGKLAARFPLGSLNRFSSAASGLTIVSFGRGLMTEVPASDHVSRVSPPSQLRGGEDTRRHVRLRAIGCQSSM